MTMTACYLIKSQDKNVGWMYSGYDYSSYNNLGRAHYINTSEPWANISSICNHVWVKTTPKPHPTAEPYRPQPTPPHSPRSPHAKWHISSKI